MHYLSPEDLAKAIEGYTRDGTESRRPYLALAGTASRKIETLAARTGAAMSVIQSAEDISDLEEAKRMLQGIVGKYQVLIACIQDEINKS